MMNKRNTKPPDRWIPPSSGQLGNSQQTPTKSPVLPPKGNPIPLDVAVSECRKGRKEKAAILARAEDIDFAKGNHHELGDRVWARWPGQDQNCGQHYWGVVTGKRGRSPLVRYNVRTDIVALNGKVSLCLFFNMLKCTLSALHNLHPHHMQVLFDDGDKANAIPAGFVISASAHEAIYGDEIPTIVGANEVVGAANELEVDGGMVQT